MQPSDVVLTHDKKNERVDNGPGVSAGLLEAPAPAVEVTPAVQEQAPERIGYDPQEPRSNMIAIYGILGCLLLVAVIMGLQSYFEDMNERQIYVQVLSKDSAELKDLRLREESQLHSYKVLDTEKGIMQIPIDRAMDRMVEEAR